VKNYFFAGAYDSGNIYIYEMHKPGNEKFIRQVAVFNNKPKIIAMHWIPDRMELIVSCESGEVFFWDCINGKQICMLSHYLDMLRPFDEGEIGNTYYIPA
jgi:hypothetical protein